MSTVNTVSVGRVFLLAALTVSVSANAQTASDKKVTILQTTDLHHHANGADHTGLDVNPATATSITGAYARIAAYVTYVRASAGHPVILVDSGDWTMGTLYDLTLASRPLALSFLDSLRYDCVTLGNHEFDYTPKGLAQILGSAQSSFAFRTPIVASNMDLVGNTDLLPFFGEGKAIQSTRIQDLPNGLKVGYIGLMGKSAALDAPASPPVTFLDYSTRYSSIQDLVNGLRSAGANIVIALSHAGTDQSGMSGEDVELARRVTGIDVIASGHTHTALAFARTVVNGKWSTQIIDAGAFGTNVSRLDLTYNSVTKSSSPDASANPAMTDANLNAIQPGLVPDFAIAATVAATDQQLNKTLAPILTQIFPDYDSASLAKGIYHPVGNSAQEMVSNLINPVPSPNGLGDLAADSVRNVPNSIIAQALAASGGNPANLPSYDFTPVQVGVVATGVLRGKLPSGVPISFADVYNVLPLGLSPDSTQALPVGSPLVSSYLEPADVKKLCALQLVAQINLAPADFYLNFSGLSYTLKSSELYTYFKFATAAGVLQAINQKAATGSAPALQTLNATLNLKADNGAGLLALYGNDNPYAGALVRLNDAKPSPGQIAANLATVAQVGTAAAIDAFAGGITLNTLVVSKAIAAIDTISSFAPSDVSNTGTATELSSTARVRVVTDLYALLLLGAVEGQFGTRITAYKSPTGLVILSGADLSGLLANRVNAAPGGPGVQELKEWQALLSYFGTGLKGSITTTYASTPNFTQFPTFGAAVKTRNASYPLAGIGQFVGTLSGLQGAPLCSASPAIGAITNAEYGDRISSSGTIIVWGTGFFPGGGNSITLTGPLLSDPVTLSARSGTYFWDLSGNQINATLPAALSPGQWTASVKNACGTASAEFPITIQ